MLFHHVIYIIQINKSSHTHFLKGENITILIQITTATQFLFHQTTSHSVPDSFSNTTKIQFSMHEWHGGGVCVFNYLSSE